MDTRRPRRLATFGAVRPRWFGVAGAIVAILVAVATAFALSTGSPATARPMPCDRDTAVHTTKGPVCGVTRSGITTYASIPYAAPPVGRLRWHAPVPHRPWHAMRSVVREAPQCPNPHWSRMIGTVPGSSEDCLYLKVDVPEGARPGDRLPVIYEIHGGGFLGESRSDYGGTLVHDKAVYVYVNYRLGILGFLAHRALGAHSGDYGLQDQQAGLRWVRQNIARFGGDPHDVTIYGESAGGASVCAQMASPTARGLFDRAISGSGFYNYPDNTIWSPADCKSTYPTEAQAQRKGARFAQKVGCDHGDVAACLRKVPTGRLVAAGGQFRRPNAGGTVGPIVNGTTLTASPKDAFASGAVNRVPMIIGVSRDEFNAGAYLNRPGRAPVVADTPAQYRSLVEQQFGRHAPAVRRTYPLRRYSSPYVAYRTVMADATSVCPLLDTVTSLSAHIPVFASLNVDEGAPSPAIGRPLGAMHDATSRVLHRRPSQLPADQVVLQQQIAAAYVHFARSANPSAPHTPTWPRVHAANPRLMALDAGGDSHVVSARSVSARHHCGFWDKVTHY